jgi:malonyl CoA-acyl carrier protein transacylase
MANEGAGSFVDVGPGRALANMVRRIKDGVEVFGAEEATDQDLRKLVESLEDEP